MASLSNITFTEQNLWMVYSKSLLPDDTIHIFEYFSSSQAAENAVELINGYAFHWCRHAFTVPARSVEDVTATNLNNRQIVLSNDVRYAIQTTTNPISCSLHAKAMRIRELALLELRQAKKTLDDFKH